jgi:hypothetical protein
MIRQIEPKLKVLYRQQLGLLMQATKQIQPVNLLQCSMLHQMKEYLELHLEI